MLQIIVLFQHLGILKKKKKKEVTKITLNKKTGVKENSVYGSNLVREQAAGGWGEGGLTQQNPPVLIPLPSSSLLLLLLLPSHAPGSNCGSQLIKKHGCP